MAAKGAQPQLPAWVWLFTGVVTGLFVAFLIYLANLQSPIPTEPPPRAAENRPKPSIRVASPIAAHRNRRENSIFIPSCPRQKPWVLRMTTPPGASRSVR